MAEPEGPLVLPGEYQVKLTVAGQSFTQPLRVELDPRVHVADTALAAQLRLALEIWNAMAAQHALQGAVRGLRDQLRTLQGAGGEGAGAGGVKLDTQTGSVVAGLERAVDSLVQGSGGGELAGFEAVVESADREPTRQAREVFAEVRARLARAARRWQEVQASELPALNARLQRQGLGPVRPAAVQPPVMPIP